MHKFNSNPAKFRLYRFVAALALLILGILWRDHSQLSAPLIANTSAYALLLVLLLPCFYLQKTRAYAILCACFCIGLWRADSVLPQNNSAFTCSGLWQISHFPSRHSPIGQRLSLRLIEGDCPALRSRALIATHFSPQTRFQIGESFSAQLTIDVGKRQFYATLPQALEKSAYPTPLITRYRAALGKHIDALFPKQRAWVRALIIGDRQLLSPQQRRQLQITGTSHLLAISGLHLAVMMGVFYWLGKICTALTRLRYWIEPHSLALASALIAGLGFALITGAQAPILRAWLMFACLFLIWLNLPLSSGLIALVCALFIILIIEPMALFALSTWLSFLTTAAVIIILQRIKEHPIWQQWILLQTGITLALSPIIWSIFGGISLISIAINLLIVPWLAALLCLLLAALIMPNLAPLATQALIAYLRPIELANQFPFAYFELPYQPPLITATLTTIALLFCFAQRLRLCAFLFACACLSAFIPLLDKSPYLLPNARLPSVIIYPPNSAPIIINTGYRSHNRNDAKRYLLPHLRQRFARPQAIILTKDSRYATGGIATLLAAYPNTPIYTLSPMPELSFAHQYCPEFAHHAAIQFIRTQECQLVIGKHRISAQDFSTITKPITKH